MIRTRILAASCFLLGACAHFDPIYEDDFALDEAEFVEAVYLTEDAEPLVVERVEPLPMPGQLKPVEEGEPKPSVRPDKAIDKANEAAAIQPDEENFVNAIQIYPYTVGALYQVYCAPEQVTDIALQPGEQLMSVSAGDTVRWVLGDTLSGSGEAEQVHILVKPTASGLSTNLIIATSKRTYHLEMRSYRETYMAAVSWRYPQEELRAAKNRAEAWRAADQHIVERGFEIDRLNFRYDVEGDDPQWRPLRAFDDGRKVFIQFPARLDQGEAPPLFVVGRDGTSQLVNYRIKGSYYVVDRLFAAAELRLGEDDQAVVRILRTPSGKHARLADR
ncbi:MAG: P-type conjugative transfer protein TrbG [Pseudomonadota bacterium]